VAGLLSIRVLLPAFVTCTDTVPVPVPAAAAVLFPSLQKFGTTPEIIHSSSLRTPTPTLTSTMSPEVNTWTLGTPSLVSTATLVLPLI
jgi:hypothetical protein